MSDSERQRLLPSPAPSESPLDLKHPPSVLYELKHIAGKSLPLVLGFLLESGIGLSSVAIAGRLGAVQLGVVGQGYMIQVVTGSIITLAATSTQVTLSSPLFTSPDHEKEEVGIILQRSLILANLGAIPIYVLWWFITPVMKWLGQPESLAEGLAPFLKVMILGQPGFVLMEACKSYLQVQGMMAPPTILVGLLLPFHIAICYYLTLHTTLGIVGAALSIAITFWAFAILLVIWIRNSRASVCWGGWSRSSLDGWSQFVKIWMPAIVMWATEWWAFEIVALFAGRLGEVPVAAQAGLSSLDGALSTIAYAISLCCSARLGNLMGYGPSSIPRLKSVVRATLILEIGVTLSVATILLASRGKLGLLFTDDRETRELISNVLIPMAAYQLFDGLQGVGAGILRSTGRQDLGSLIHMLSYYGVGLPLAYFLAFCLSWGLVGLWTAQVVALAFVSGAELLIYFFPMKWEKEVGRAEERGEESM